MTMVSIVKVMVFLVVVYGCESWTIKKAEHPETETPVLWPPDAKSWLTGKDPDAGKDWGQEEKGTTEDEMGGWHHWLNGYGFGWTLGVGDGQGGLTCCCSWGHKELDMTERLNWTERIDALEWWCGWRLLRISWTAKRSNQSILKEISSEYSLEGLMLKLKLQYFGYLMRKTDSLEKTLMMGKIEGRRRRGQQRMRWLDGISA